MSQMLPLLAVAGLLLAPLGASADAVADFYAKRQIRLLIGYTAGGGYDLYARVLARHMSAHLPGNPTILPENMPGAGSLRAANYLYAAAPKDGTVFATFSRGMAMEAVLNHSQGVMFQAPNFNWLGSITDEVSVCAFTAASGVKTWADMKTASYTIGGTASGSDTDIFPTVLRDMFGLKLKLVTGFPGGSDVDLALRRKEIDGRCGWSWSSLMARDRSMYESHEIYVPLQIGLTRHAALPDVPSIVELGENPTDTAVLKLVASRQAMARPFAAPPGLPAERADALRAAILEKYNMSLGNGLGPLKDRVFRIGHLGDFSDLQLIGTLGGIEMGLRVAGVPHSRGGAQAAIDYLSGNA